MVFGIETNRSVARRNLEHRLGADRGDGDKALSRGGLPGTPARAHDPTSRSFGLPLSFGELDGDLEKAARSQSVVLPSAF